MQTLQKLQEHYSHLESVNITSKDELTVIEITNPRGSAEILLLGAQLITFSGADDTYPVIWKSKETVYKQGTPVRGGIPIIAPWFGGLDTNPKQVQSHNAHPQSAPAHGFVRSQLWTLDGISENLNQGKPETIVTLSLNYDASTPELWNRSFKISVQYTVSDTLAVELKIENTSADDMTLSLALHTYFAVSHCSHISIPSFDGATYIDALDDWQQKTWQGPLSFDREVDVVFQGLSSSQEIIDQDWNRRIALQTKGSTSAVVWNPWIDKSKRLSMFGAQEYKDMLCIETANVMDDIKVIPAGKSHTMKLSVSTTSI